MEQYTRRPNLGIYGVPLVENESPVNVEEKVININDCNVGIDVSSLDLAHRVGKIIY